MFSERELIERDADDFEHLRRNGLLRRLPIEPGPRSLVVAGGRRLTIIDEGAAFTGFDDEPDSSPVSIPATATAMWCVNIDRFAKQFKDQNRLASPAGSLHRRLYLLGTSSAGRAVVLALLSSRTGLDLLKALPALAPSGMTDFLAVCPTYVPPLTELDALRAIGVSTTHLNRNDPLHLPDDTMSSADTTQVLRADFDHLDDYRWVKCRGLEFELVEPAAKVVRILDLARLSNKPLMSWAQISSQLPTAPPKMSHVFRGVKNWHELIERRGRDLYRLNV